MSKNAISQDPDGRPDEFSGRDHADTATLDNEPRPLRSVEEILEERLAQREDRDEVENGGEGTNNTGDRPHTVRADRGGVPDEDFPGASDEQELTADHGTDN